MTTSKRTFAAALALLMLAGLCFAICARADGPLVVLVASPSAPVEYVDNVEITVQLLGGAPPYTVTLRYTIIEGGARYPFVKTEEDSTGRVQFFIPVDFGEGMEYTLHVTDTDDGIYDSDPQTVAFVGTPAPAPLKILSARMETEFIPPSGTANLMIELEGGQAPFSMAVSQYAYKLGNIPIKEVWEDSAINIHTWHISYPITPPEELPYSYPEADYLKLRGTIEDVMGRTVALPDGLIVYIYYPLTSTISLDEYRLLPGQSITATANVSGGKPPYSCQFSWRVRDAGSGQQVTRTPTGAGPQFRDSFQLDYGAVTPPVKAHGSLQVVIRDSGWGRGTPSLYGPFIIGPPGDIYGDGKLDIRDLGPMMDHALKRGLDMEELSNADMNGSGGCSIDDVLLLINLLVK